MNFERPFKVCFLLLLLCTLFSSTSGWGNELDTNFEGIREWFRWQWTWDKRKWHRHQAIGLRRHRQPPQLILIHCQKVKEVRGKKKPKLHWKFLLLNIISIQGHSGSDRRQERNIVRERLTRMQWDRKERQRPWAHPAHHSQQNKSVTCWVKNREQLSSTSSGPCPTGRSTSYKLYIQTLVEHTV